MIDLHTHTLLSDGALLPSELVRRAEAAGYTAIAITDHADSSNLEEVVTQTVRFCDAVRSKGSIRAVPGVELTHVLPALIPELVDEARALGAALVLGHGETIAEPVLKGTNKAFIKAGVDLLAHPGLITAEDARLAKKSGVLLEITTRKGHSLTNGHVANAAKAAGALLVINNDAHAPGDFMSQAASEKVALGAGLTTTDFKKMRNNASKLIQGTLY